MRVKHSVDIGNYSILAISNGVHPKPLYYKSVIAPILPGARVMPTGTTSVVVQGEFGNFHIGDRASDYGSLASGLVNMNKLDPKYFIPCILGTLGPIGDKVTYDVELYWSLPDPDRLHSETQTLGQYLKEKLEGTFAYKYTDERGSFDMSVRIIPQDPRPEGYDALVMAREMNFLPDTGYVIGADIGGGTLDITCVNARNDIMLRLSYNGAQGSAIAGGKALASMIKINPLMIQRVGGQLSLEHVMSALANPRTSESGKTMYVYQADNNELVDFTDLAKEAIVYYFGQINGEIASNFNQYMPTSGRMIFGGCAYLFMGRLPKGAAYIPNSPDYANIMALDWLSMKSKTAVGV